MAAALSSPSDRTWEPVVAEHQPYGVTARADASNPGQSKPHGVSALARESERTIKAQHTSDSAKGVGIASAAQRLVEEHAAIASIGPIYDALHEERGLLVAEELRGALTSDGRRRLTYICWQLDRYEMAMLGPDIREVRAVVDKHAAVAESISQFIGAVKQASSPSARKHPRPPR